MNVPISQLAALARRGETRRWIRCELSRMDEDEILRTLVEEYDRSAELEACEAQISALEREIDRLEREVTEAEDEAREAAERVEEARQSMTAVIQALNTIAESHSEEASDIGRLAEEIRALAWDPQDHNRRKRIESLADQMRRKG